MITIRIFMKKRLGYLYKYPFSVHYFLEMFPSPSAPPWLMA
jgi:hypothetical protein